MNKKPKLTMLSKPILGKLEFHTFFLVVTKLGLRKLYEAMLLL